MAKIITPRERKKETWTELEFYKKDTGEVCLGFPIVNGEVKPMTEAGMENYLAALTNDQLYSKEIKCSHTYIEPAHAICECGKEILLNYDAEECEYCGRLHNLFGQELLPRHMWEEEWDDDEDYPW